jgi:hypothetical protein
MAMCIAGTTTTTQWGGAGIFLEFAFSGAIPDSGFLLGDGAWNPAVPLPALIDASAYSGIQFWLWVSPDTVAGVSPNFQVWLSDKNETAGFGVCDETVMSATPRSCGAAQAAPAQAATPASTMGPFLGADGGALALSAGWQLVQVPWANFLTNPTWGGAWETAVDPKTLTSLVFWVVHVSGPAIPYNFCVYQVSFYK